MPDSICHSNSMKCYNGNAISLVLIFWRTTFSSLGRPRQRVPRSSSMWERLSESIAWLLWPVGEMPSSTHSSPDWKIAARLRAAASLNELDQLYVHEVAVSLSSVNGY